MRQSNIDIDDEEPARTVKFQKRFTMRIPKDGVHGKQKRRKINEKNRFYLGYKKFNDV